MREERIEREILNIYHIYFVKETYLDLAAQKMGVGGECLQHDSVEFEAIQNQI